MVQTFFAGCCRRRRAGGRRPSDPAPLAPAVRARRAGPRRRAWAAVALLLASLVDPRSIAAGEAGQEVSPPGFWMPIGLDEAREQARRESRGVLAGFFADWSATSREFEAALSGPRMQALLRARTVPLRFDLMTSPAAAASLHVKIVPTVILLGPDGSELERWTGPGRPSAWAREIELALAGDTSLDRARSQLDPDDYRGRLRILAQLVTTGRYEDAFPELVWLLDSEFGEGFTTSGRYGRDRQRLGPPLRAIRYYNVVALIARMRFAHPPAQQLLSTRFENARQAVVASPGDPFVTDSFRVLAGALGERMALVEAYRAIPDGDFRKALRRDVFNELVSRRAYDEAAAVFPIEEIVSGIERPLGEMTAFRGVVAVLFPVIGPRALHMLQHREVMRNARYFEAFAGAGRVVEARRIAEAMQRIGGFDENLVGRNQHARVGLSANVVSDLGSVLVLAAHRARPDDAQTFLEGLGVPELLTARSRELLQRVAATPAPGLAEPRDDVLVDGAVDEVPAEDHEAASAGDAPVMLDPYVVADTLPGVLPCLGFRGSNQRQFVLRPVDAALVVLHPELAAFDCTRWGARPGEGVVAIDGEEVVGMSEKRLLALWGDGEAGAEVRLVVQGAGADESRFREFTVQRVGWVRHRETGKREITVEPDARRPNRSGSAPESAGQTPSLAP